MGCCSSKPAVKVPPPAGAAPPAVPAPSQPPDAHQSGPLGGVLDQPIGPIESKDGPPVSDDPAVQPEMAHESSVPVQMTMMTTDGGDSPEPTTGKRTSHQENINSATDGNTATPEDSVDSKAGAPSRILLVTPVDEPLPTEKDIASEVYLAPTGLPNESVPSTQANTATSASDKRDSSSSPSDRRDSSPTFDTPKTTDEAPTIIMPQNLPDNEGVKSTVMGREAAAAKWGGMSDAKERSSMSSSIVPRQSVISDHGDQQWITCTPMCETDALTAASKATENDGANRDTVGEPIPILGKDGPVLQLQAIPEEVPKEAIAFLPRVNDVPKETPGNHLAVAQPWKDVQQNHLDVNKKDYDWKKYALQVNTEEIKEVPGDSDMGAVEPDALTRKYEVGSKLGEGTFGVVHSCYRKDDRSKTELAVKYIDKHAQDKESIIKETNIMRKLRHDNIVQCMDVFNEPYFMCIVMDKWAGRDVVSQLITLLETKELPEMCVSNLVRQMIASMVYLHQKGVVHRDVKMDNFLLDRPTIDDPTVKCAISDFGCATYLSLGKRMSESVGTKVYKAPEFIMEDYDHKVDIWAVGVSMYALLAGTLPFNSERGILTLRPPFPEALSGDCLDLVKTLLRKNDGNRPSAREASAHPFLRMDLAQDMVMRRLSTHKTFNKSSLETVRVHAVDDVTAERREVLMARMQSVHQKDDQPVDLAILGKDDFEVAAPNNELDVRKYGWLPKSQSSAVLNAQLFPHDAPAQSKGRGRLSLVAAQESPTDPEDLLEVAWTPQVVETLLASHKIDVNAYGFGVAKLVDELAEEVRKGDAMLMQDVTKHKKLVRLVDHVVMEVELDLQSCGSFDSPLASSLPPRVVLVVKEGGKFGPSCLPGLRRKPYESTRQAAARLLADMEIEDVHFSLNHEQAERVEADEANEHYPGLPTIRRRHIIPAKLTVTSGKALKMLSLEGKSSQTLKEGKDVLFSIQNRHFAWLTPQRCQASGVSLVGASADAVLGRNFSALVRMPLNYSEAIVHRLLWSYGFDDFHLQENGDAVAKLAHELTKGEAALCERQGQIIKVTSLVMMYIEDMSTSNALLELEHALPDGVKANKRLPYVKLRPQEDLQDAISRLLNNRLGFAQSAVHVLDGRTELVEEYSTDTGALGLKTLMRKHIVRAKAVTAGDNLSGALLDSQMLDGSMKLDGSMGIVQSGDAKVKANRAKGAVAKKGAQPKEKAAKAKAAAPKKAKAKAKK